MDIVITNDYKLKKTLVFHLNKIGSLIIYILLPEELKNNPKQMKFLHKCESNQLEIKIKNINNQILLDYSYYFNDNSFSVINMKKTLPKIIALSPQGQNNNSIKYLFINYSITKSAINDYYFADKILNYDTSYDYLEKIIERNYNKNYKKLFVANIFCANCNNNLFLPQKEIIHDYDSVRIEQNLEEFFNCQNNYNSFMKNKDATQGIENLKKTYEVKYNMDTLYLWSFNKYLEFNNEHETENNKNKIDYLFCDKCKEIIGIKEEYNNISFNKLFLNLINMELILDNNKDNIININNFFSVDYLHVLLNNSIKKGNKFLKFINMPRQLEIIFETKINILGLIDKNNEINNNEKLNINENILIDNYINMFEINFGQFSKEEIINNNSNENIILNEKDFNILENIIKENMEFYFSELFFYKLLTNENKKFYCFSIPRKNIDKH